jgi:hypothetical protein
MACSSDTSVGDDAGADGTVADAPNDAATKDVSKEASDDAAPDAPDDAPADAPDDAMLDAPDDAPQDAAVDADDSGVIDAGSLDAGKGCLGVFCIIGDTCCNNANSVNYGKCEPTSCKTCCK